MGKSLRSKRKQKLKRVRKEKCKVKELKMLKDMLIAAGENLDQPSDAVMVDTELLKVRTARKSAADTREPCTGEAPQKMEVTKSGYDPVTLKNEHGNYPIWMNRRQMKRHRVLSSRRHSAESYSKGHRKRL